jgi:hypothetical protein
MSMKLPNEPVIDHQIFRIELTIAIPKYYCDDHGYLAEAMSFITIDDEATLLGVVEQEYKISPITS